MNKGQGDRCEPVMSETERMYLEDFSPGWKHVSKALRVDAAAIKAFAGQSIRSRSTSTITVTHVAGPDCHP